MRAQKRDKLNRLCSGVLQMHCHAEQSEASTRWIPRYARNDNNSAQDIYVLQHHDKRQVQNSAATPTHSFVNTT